MALPVLPVLLALAVLEWTGVPDLPVPAADGAGERVASASLRHGSDRLLFAAAASIHTFVCVSAMIYFAMQIIRIGGPDRRAVTVTAIVVAAGVLAMMVALGFLDPPLAAYRYTYFRIEALLGSFDAARDLVGAGSGLPTLAVCVLYPSALGVVAVVLASAVACAASARIRNSAASGAPGELAAYVRILLHCFYVLSGVLVTSTATALLFFRLPFALSSGAAQGDAFAAALAAYASGLGTFWAAIYTLTLFAVFAGPAAVLYARVQTIVDGEGKGTTVAEWLKGNGVAVSLGESIKNLLVLIAPLLVGPIGELAGLVGG